MKILISLFSIVYNFKKDNNVENNTGIGSLRELTSGKDNRYMLYEDFESKTKIFENLNKKKILDKLENMNLNNENKLQ
jgi:hypothetical protein